MPLQENDFATFNPPISTISSHTRNLLNRSDWCYLANTLKSYKRKQSKPLDYYGIRIRAINTNRSRSSDEHSKPQTLQQSTIFLTKKSAFSNTNHGDMCLRLQDEKNQIINTNIWLNIVRSSLFLQKLLSDTFLRLSLEYILCLTLKGKTSATRRCREL